MAILARPIMAEPKSAPDPMHLSSDDSWWTVKAGAWDPQDDGSQG